MKDIFKIIKVENYNVVLLNNSSRITDVLLDVANSIKAKNYNGNVVFDLLLANGPSNRFFIIPFEEDKFIINKIVKVDQPSTKLLMKANEYYLKNIEFMNESFISRFEKNNIKSLLKVKKTLISC